MAIGYKQNHKRNALTKSSALFTGVDLILCSIKIHSRVSGATAIVLCMTYGVGLKDTDYANKIARLFYPPFTTKEL